MYKNILIPILLNEDCNTEASYSVSRALAENDCKFTVLHVVEAVPAYITSGIPTELLEKRHDEMKESLGREAMGLPGSTPVLISGHAGNTIVDYAEKNDIDCIIVNSHKPGIQDFFLGSTAARVVRHAQCAVHVIR